MLRKAAERTVDALWNAIGRLIDLFTPNECDNYFAACGYDCNMIVNRSSVFSSRNDVKSHGRP